MRSRPTQQTIRQAQDAWRSHEASTRRVSGYAIVFGKLSLDLGGFVEVIARSAPARSLQENKDILALASHRTDQLLGRTSNHTLQLKIDSTGLLATIDLPKTSAGNDVLALVERRDYQGMSFGFNVRSEVWDLNSYDLPLRTITDLDLIEVSIVALPAYPDTTISLEQASWSPVLSGRQTPAPRRPQFPKRYFRELQLRVLGIPLGNPWPARR
jgi:HK97 family phage prohead protease